jgi:hypothetical protein
MSEELLRRSIELWNADDWEALGRMWDPEGEVVAPEGWPESGTFRGWPAIQVQFERLKGSWAEERVEILGIREVPSGLFADIRWIVKGDASGAPLEVDMWALYEFRGELVRRIDYFLDRDAAEAAGG